MYTNTFRQKSISSAFFLLKNSLIIRFKQLQYLFSFWSWVIRVPKCNNVKIQIVRKEQACRSNNNYILKDCFSLLNKILFNIGKVRDMAHCLKCVCCKLQ